MPPETSSVSEPETAMLAGGDSTLAILVLATDGSLPPPSLPAPLSTTTLLRCCCSALRRDSCACSATRSSVSSTEASRGSVVLPSPPLLYYPPAPCCPLARFWACTVWCCHCMTALNCLRRVSTVSSSVSVRLTCAASLCSSLLTTHGPDTQQQCIKVTDVTGV